MLAGLALHVFGARKNNRTTTYFFGLAQRVIPVSQSVHTDETIVPL